MEALMQALQERFPDDVVLRSRFRGEWNLEVPRARIHSVLQFLKAEQGMDFLIDLTAVDWLDRKTPRFEVVYWVGSVFHNRKLRLHVPVPESDPTVPSVADLYKAALWLEREVYDLFGLRFEGHPDLKRILLWEGFEGHPLRKDYPLRKRVPLPEPR